MMLQLGAFRTTLCAASQHALSASRKHIVQQLNKGVSPLQRRNTLAGRQAQLRQCLHSQPAELRVQSQL